MKTKSLRTNFGFSVENASLSILIVAFLTLGASDLEGQCSINLSGLSNISCNDGGSPEGISDDFIQFELNPSGTDLGSGYTVSVSSGTILPTSASYGSSTTFYLNPGSAGAGDVTLTITDDTDLLCSLMETITDPGACSDPCPDPYNWCPGDSFTLTAESGMASYQWFVYNTATMMFDPIPGETNQIYIATTTGIYKWEGTDADGCFVELCCPVEIVDGPMVSPDIVVSCDDNGTSDPTDDVFYYTIDINKWPRYWSKLFY